MEKVMSVGRKALIWLLSAMLVVGWGGLAPCHDTASSRCSQC